MSAPRRGYQVAGGEGAVAGAAAASAPFSGIQTFLIVVIVVVGLIAAGVAGTSMWFGVTAWQTNSAQDTRLLTGEIRTTNLEANLDIEMTTRLQEDAALQAQVDDRIASLNQVHGDSIHNVDLVVNGTGFCVTPSNETHQIFLENKAVLDINDVFPVPGAGTLFLEGTGMIDVMSTPSTSTLTVNGSAIVTSLSNLQMQVSMQQVEIMELQTNATTTQMVIDALVQSLMAGGNETNITAVIIELVANISMAMSDISTLQQQVANITMDAILPGMLIPWTGASGGPYPAGYLVCDGTEYLIVDYPELYAVVGTMYCPGPCSMITKFAVPDMRGRVVAHKGGSSLNTAIGVVVGAETHTLSAAQMPFHQHGGSTNADGDHAHSWFVQVGTGGHSSPGPSIPCSANPPYIGYQFNAMGGVACGDTWGPNYWTGLSTGFDTTLGFAPPSSAIHSHGFTTSGAGSGGAHNNIQPTMVMQYLIKT